MAGLTWPMLIGLITEVGLPLTLELIDLWKKNPEPTEAVIERLRQKNKETLQSVIDSLPET